VARRRWFPALAVGLVLVLTAAAAPGCGGGSGPTSAEPPATDTDGSAPPPPEPTCPVDALEPLTAPVAITAWASVIGDGRAALDLVVARYNAAQTRVRVTVAEAPADPVAQRGLYALAAASGELPALVALDTTITQYLIDTGTVIAASDCRKADGSPDNSLPVVRNATTTGDTHWAGSASPETDVLFYRRDAFAAAGLDPDSPPRSLAELEADARKLKDAGAPTPPIALAGDSSLVENWLTGVGVDIVDHANGHQKHATESTFDNPRTLELYTWVQRMTRAGLLAIEPATAGQEPAAAPVARLQHAAMTVATSTLIGSIAAATAAPMPDVDVGPFPGIDAAGRGKVEGLAWYPTTTGSATVRAAAWDFLIFLNTPPSQVTMNLTGSYLPDNIRATDDPALEAMWTGTRRGRWLDTAYTQLTNLDPAIPGPLIGPYDETRAAIRASLEAVAAGAPPADAIATANRAINEALADYRPDRPDRPDRP